MYFNSVLKSPTPNMKILFLTFSTAIFLVISFQEILYASGHSKKPVNEVIVFSQSPRNLQFFARDIQDSADVTFDGSLFTAGFDSVYLEVYRNNILWKRKSSKLIYVSGSAPFELSQKVHAELSEYNFKLYLKDTAGANNVLIKNADSIICGDAYIISGQSNSHNTNDTATYKNEFCRSFGVQTPNGNMDAYNPADTNWGLSRAVNYLGNGWTGPYNVGVWGLYLQKQIRDSNGIPTCFINGGTRGSSIEINLRNNSNQTDLTTIYGKLLYRVIKSGLAGNIKAIFWYQGEANGDASWVNYENNFRTIYNSWKENYPSFKKIFSFQVRQGCSGNLSGGLLREVQRQLVQKYPDMEITSTMGIQAHGGDHCHYGFPGYYEVALNIYRQVAKAFYTISDVTDISPPNISAAYYTTTAKTEIALQFSNSSISSWPADTLSQRMRDYFYLDGAYGNVNTGTIAGQILKLQLVTASNATKLSYLPSKYNNGTTVTYEGPFIRNSRRIGALSFNDFPISNYPPSTLNLTYCLQGFYNSSSENLNKRDTVRVILRNNFFPYQVKDSSKAVIDSVSLTGSFTFRNVPTGIYYIVTKTRNGIETWSKSGTEITNNTTVSYDFTSSGSKAYGDNLILVGDKYCVYSGDVNQDGSVDLSDLSMIDNDAAASVEGYVKTDLTGDSFVDLSDLSIADNSATAFASVIKP
jgi:Carbohydrate esterase, sialic acid-specific acetylesterase